jgi:ornithine decarboxylase
MPQYASSLAASRGRRANLASAVRQGQQAHAVSPVETAVSTTAITACLNDMVATLRSDVPVYVTDLAALAENAAHFLDHFPGDVAYAVKCNPDPVFIRGLADAGVTVFDVASLNEIKLVQSIAPRAKLYFMHPVKSRDAIAQAYFTHGVRAFVLDTEQELEKIVAVTGNAADLELFVRVTLPKNDSATIDFSCKFGATPDEAAELLQLARPHAARLGLAFHVGTQTVDKHAYDTALDVVVRVIDAAGVRVDALDIGGGFPADYDHSRDFHNGRVELIRHIRKAILKRNLGGMDLVCEPGRALVARAQSLLLRVEQRRGNDTLYINDGTYGGLADSGALVGQAFPVRAIRTNGRFVDAQIDYTVYGPTCDSLDKLAMPLRLPADISEGDFIEVGHSGAYSQSLRTDFNGFGAASHFVIGLDGQLESGTLA